MSLNFVSAVISSTTPVIKNLKVLKICQMLIAALSVLCGFGGLAIANFDKDDHAAMERVIEQYIKDNPEVLRDALIGLAEKEEQANITAGLAKVRQDKGDPIIGNVNGNLVVYEFSDYNCGYCKRMFPAVQQLITNNLDIRVVVKEFPILSQSSLTAARAGIAAQRQHKFPAYHREMMTYRGQVSDASIMAAARTAGLDLDQLRLDMDSPTTSAIIDRTRAGAAALNLNGTPALVVGETIIPGAVSFDKLQDIIDSERAKQ